MSCPRTQDSRLAAERGFTLVELVIGMALTTVISLAAFGFLRFVTSDASRTTERVHVDQVARTTLERIMLELHSTCVTPSIAPIKPESTENVIKFVSESGEESAYSVVHKHEIIFSSAEGTLTEKVYASVPPPTGKAAPEYTFKETPSSTVLLLKGIKQSESSEGTKIPIFQYFRYYKEGDTTPEGSKTFNYGELNPTRMSATALKSESQKISKVTVSFTVTPEGKEGVSFNHDRPVPLEDSAVFRLAPSSEATSNTNLPCAPES
jgi:prepilin-type N-terminal cleavage/methylation domain-containing protein